MVVRLLGAASVLAAAAGAQGAFTIFSVDAGGFGPITGGTPLQPTGGSLFVFAGGGNNADVGTHNLLVPFAGAGGAGVGMVGIQPGGPNHVSGTNAANLGFANPINGIGFAPQTNTNTVTAAQLQGFWNTTVQVPSSAGPAPGGAADGIAHAWIARLGVTEGFGLNLATSGLRIGMSENGINDSVVAITQAGTNVDLDAAPNPLANFYRIEAVRVTNEQLVGFDVYDVYAVQFVPTPGAAALLGVAGLAAVRRRRA